MGEVSIKQFGHVPKRPLGKKLGNRPSTTDGLSPRQQVRTAFERHSYNEAES